MERNYPAAGFGDLGAGTGWSYDRPPKASVYGSAGSSQPDSELLHRQIYAPHTLQGYATSNHSRSSRPAAAWGAAGRPLALESQGPQPMPSASLLSQFRTPSWQSAMHTPAPAELFISGALPGSGSLPSSSTLSAYQYPGSFSGRSFTSSLSLQDAPTFSPASNGLLSPHDPLLHIKTPAQSSLGFERLLSSPSVTYRGSHEPQTPSQIPSTSSSCHLTPPPFDLLSSQLYNASMFSSAPALLPAAQPQPPPEREVSRQDSVIKHYQSATLQQYASCGGSSGYQQIVSQHQHAGMPCSPLEEQSPSTDLKPSPQMESQTYQPISQIPYTSSSSNTFASSTSATKGLKTSNSTSGYSSSGSASSSSHTPHTPPLASSTTSSSSSSSKTSITSLPSSSHQQPPSQSASALLALPVVSSTLVHQPAPKQCLPNYGSQSVLKSNSGPSDQSPPQPQSYSPSQPSSTNRAQPYGGFGSPHAQDLSSVAGVTGGKSFTGIVSGGRSFSAEIVFKDSSFASASLRTAGSPSLGYGSESTRIGPAAHDDGGGSSGSGSGAAGVGNESTSSYHLPESRTSPSVSYPALHSPAAAHPAQSPGGPGATKYHSSILSPAYMSSQQAFAVTRQIQCQSYHVTQNKPKTEKDMLPDKRSQNREEDNDFLISHLLHPQSSASLPSQHHSHLQQLPQSISQARDAEGKDMTYDTNKISDDQYHPKSVICTNNTVSSLGLGNAVSDTSGLNGQLEISLKKQQTKSKLTVPKSHTTDSHPQPHELGSVVHYGRGGPYTQNLHSQHPHHPSHSQQHPQQIPEPFRYTHHTQTSQSHQSSHLLSHSHIELKKTSNTGDTSYLCNTADVHAQQSQAPLSLMDSSPDPPQPAHMMQSVLSHTTHAKMDPQQALTQQQLQPVTDSAGRAEAVRVDPHPQKQSSQLQLQLQNQILDPHYSLAAQTRDQTQAVQNSVSRIDDSGGPMDRTGVGVTVRDGDGGNQLRQQHRITPHNHPQQQTSELHDFLTEPDLGISTPSHLHHLNQSLVHGHSHALQEQQVHIHHQLPHTQLSHTHTSRMTVNMEAPQQPQQSQPRQHEAQLSHSQLDQFKEHQFDTISPVDKVGQNPVQQQRFASLTSICFPDSLLQDEDRSFFPEMEDIFCSSEYKSSCAEDSGAKLGGQENLSQGHGRVQEGTEALKAGSAGEEYDIVGHRSDQGYGPYCLNRSGTGTGNVHLDLDSLKTHELPSTVNTDQLGLIQSQTPSMGLGSAAQRDGSDSKLMGNVGGSSNTTGLTSPIFCSSRPKKLLKTSSFHLLKQRREPQHQTKKNYAQEYEFEDDEDKADVPADIRLNSRRIPDLLPDLVSNCRRVAGTPGVSCLSPVMGDLDFCQTSSYCSLGHTPQLLPHDGPKKRGRKPTKPKREGPPRPRGRPRIRPLPEPPYCRGMVGSGAGETRRGRGRGRGRGRREAGLMGSHRNMNKAQSLTYHQQQPYTQQHYSQQPDLHQAPQQQLEHQLHQQQQQQVSCAHHQLHHQQHYYQQQQPSQQDPVTPVKIKLPVSTLLPSESLLRTDSLSSSEPVLSDGSVGSAPSLGLSPGPNTTMDISRNDLDLTQDKMMKQEQRAAEMMLDGWKKESEDPLNPEAWAATQKLSSLADDFRPGFMASFLDFLKVGKKQSDHEPGHDGSQHDAVDPCSSLREGIRPLSPNSLPATPPQQLPGAFSKEGQGGGADLALSDCSSPCKPLDEELKGNLEALPSFSSDEEDSVSKNQDLQESISSAISALYDTPHSLAAAMASAVMKAQPTLSPATPQEPSLSYPLPAMPPLIPTMDNTKKDTFTLDQHHMEGDERQRPTSPESERDPTEDGERGPEGEEEKEVGNGGEETRNNEEMLTETQNVEEEEKGDEEEDEDRISEMLEAPKAEESPSEPALALPFPTVSPSPPTYSSPLPLPLLCSSVTTTMPIQQDKGEGRPYPLSEQSFYQPPPTAGTSPPPSTSPPPIPSSPLSNLPHSVPPPSTTPPPSSSDQDQEPEVGQASPSSSSPSSSSSSEPPSPPTPDEAPASQRLTSLHLAKKQADAAIAGESEEEDSESGGEGIFRERDEFVVRTEDIGTLKMALQTGREPPPIWRVQKALLQKFSPEIKDGQRQFCATSNYLGYFGDAKMRYQRLYVKFLENINKKDYVRVCSRKPWHRVGLAMRRQSLAIQLQNIHSQNQPQMEKQKERDMKKQRERQNEERKREQREKMEKNHMERERNEKNEQREWDKKEKEKMTKKKEDKIQNEIKVERETFENEQSEKREMEQNEQKERERREYEREMKDINRSNREQKERERDHKEMEKKEREQKQREKEEKELREKEREKSHTEQIEREKQDREKQEKERREKKKQEIEKREKQREDVEKEKRGIAARDRREITLEVSGLKEEKRGGEKMKSQSRTLTEPPPKKRKWLKEVRSSSESDSSPPSDDEGAARGGLNSRVMREMFRSYVEMLVSTALDPDMIQALEDTDDELYLPPMRKIDSLLSEQKKKLLRRVNMSAQHQEALHVFPKMTADPLESGSVRVHLGGDGYNRKTLNWVKKSFLKQQDMKLSIETCRIYSLYHSLHHYKYHTFLHCKKETDSIEQAAEDPGQEEVVQQCMANQGWLESLFSSFMELVNLSAKA
ncbi:proline-rich protein 12 [Melanotaenia boesemani]|uniref:proline-rich protein 12 n=1 Tax=Melanotaenia boesemani TaxID=1250792 RepID=UPI001C04B6D6|nr:proline-rich protein 12 [Melanotaenia boesemani]